MTIAEQAAVARPLSVDTPRHCPPPLTAASPSAARLVFLRGLVWGLIGLIYAPLFLGLTAIFERLGAGPGAYAAAAALAGAAGAALYGSHELALVGTGIGAIVGVLLLTSAADLLSFTQAAAVAAALAALVGLLVSFPGQCTRRVPGKVLAGLTTGAACGALLAATLPLGPRPFSPFVMLALLVSVNGALYVTSVRWWTDRISRLRIAARPCRLIEALVLAALAGLAAGGVWLMAGPLLGDESGLVGAVAATIYDALPYAALGGILGGAVAGALLEAFGFAWVHDV